jgi:putative YhbY family RNA-binding protein
MWKSSRSGHKLPSQNTPRVRDDAVNYLPRLWDKETIPNCEGTAFEKKRLRRLQFRSRKTDATIWIGKEGTSKELLKHVANQLKARELVKVKVQKSALVETETADLAEKVASSTDSTLVEVMGHTFSLYKRPETAGAARKR